MILQIFLLMSPCFLQHIVLLTYSASAVRQLQADTLILRNTEISYAESEITNVYSLIAFLSGGFNS